MSAETIIHCFVMDEEMNHGNAVHAPEKLRQFVDDNIDNRLLVNDYYYLLFILTINRTIWRIKEKRGTKGIQKVFISISLIF